MIEDILNLFLRNQDAFFTGAWATLKVAGQIWLIGTLLGIVLCLLRIYGNRILTFVVQSMAWAISSVPVLVLLLWVHFPVQSYFGIFIDPLVTTTVVLSVVNAILVSSTLYKATENVGSQYADVAFSLDIPKPKLAMHIVLPVAWQSALPAIVTIQLTMLHSSIFASLISGDEILRAAQRIVAVEYRPVEVYTILGLFFVGLSVPLMLASAGLGRWMRGRFDER